MADSRLMEFLGALALGGDPEGREFLDERRATREQRRGEEQAHQRDVQLELLKAALKPDPSKILESLIPGGSRGGGVVDAGIIPAEPPSITDSRDPISILSGIPRPGRPRTTETPQFGITGMSVDPASGSFRINIGEPEAAKQRRELEAKTSRELAKRRQETQEGFRRAMGLFQNLTAQFKTKLNAQGGRGGIGRGFMGVVRSRVKAEGAAPIAAFEGQRNETALSLNNIITGQNRVIKGVVGMLLETLPTAFDTEGFAAQKIAQSISNSFRLLIANNRGLLTEDVLAGFNADGGAERVREFVSAVELTAAEQQALRQLIDRVLSTPPAKIETLFPDVEEGAANRVGRFTVEVE